MKNKFSKAFSLVELSIVILVVGILLAAITKGKDLYSDMQLKTAQSVTSSSLINSMQSVSLWLDTTTLPNIRDANKKQIDFNDNVHFWRDNKAGTPATTIELASIATGASVTDENKPQLIRSGFSGLPTIEFDGANYFTLDNASKSPLTDNDDTYTIALAFKTYHLETATGTPLFIGTDANHFSMDLTSNTAFTISHHATNEKTSNVYDALRTNIFIIVVNNNNTNNIKIFNNSNTSTDVATATPGLSSIEQGVINVAANGSATSTPGFKGQISEVIVFNKELSTNEVAEVNQYFKQKYNVPINN